MRYYSFVPHTATQIRSLLRRLDGEPADAIESDVLECKPWHAGGFKEQLAIAAESVVCLANANGGTLILGVRDGVRSRADAIGGVGDVDPEAIRRAIFDRTEPHLTVDIEELDEPEGRLLLVRVPRGVVPHTTSDGLAKIRIGKECRPLTGAMLTQLVVERRAFDPTAQVVVGATLRDLDAEHVTNLQRRVATGGGKMEMARLPRKEFLGNLGLVQDDTVTLAAVLLVGRSAALARWAPQHELVFIRYTTATRYDARQDLKGPIVAVLDTLQQRLEAHLKLALVDSGGFGELAAPDLTWWTAREAVLNAVVHRDYFLNQSVYVELHPGRVEVSSPGGFVGGVGPENILRHPPVRRNPLLADVLQAAGYVNRAGMGVDRIYEELLRLGKPMPAYETDVGYVRLILRTRSYAPFARFVADETRHGRSLDLDDLIVLRGVTDRARLDRWSAARVLQTKDEAEAAHRLTALKERAYLVSHGRGKGTSYRLARGISDLLRGPLVTDEGLDLDAEAVRLRIEAVLAERGRLTNAEVRRMCGYSRAEVVRLMRSLREEGVAEVEGRGRGAHYTPGPKLQQTSKRGHPRRDS
ncbi:MAG: putative DNA binding domain-containing protein [Acidobacteria bacterium]|nr:putative DNA binding domain-containing protein [Acidobacteriota bacterium]